MNQIHKKLKIGTIDAIRVIMNPLNWFELDEKDYNYNIIKILFRHKYIHVFICEYPNVFWNIKFKKSLINSMKDWLRQYYRGEAGAPYGS